MDKWYYLQCKDKDHYRKELKNYICGFYKYSRDENKSFLSMFGYFMGDKKTVDTMERNKMRREEMAMLKDATFIKDNMVEKMQYNWSKYLENSNVNLAVLSLYQDYVDNNIDIHSLQKELATSVMPKFLKYCGFEKPKDNLEWVVALHCDRQNNYHFHIAWIEKRKSYKLKNNELGYRYKLKLDENENNFMKRQVALAIERNKLYKPAIIKINNDLKHLQSYFDPKDRNFMLKNASNLYLEEDIVRLGFLLKKIRGTDKKYIKYGSLPKNGIGKEIRFLTNKIKSELFKHNNELYLSKQEVHNSIEKLNEIFLNIDKNNNISNIEFQNIYDNELIKNKLEKSDNYILNAIVNHALYLNNSKNKINKKSKTVTLEDVIGEIAILIYTDNKDYPKYISKFKLKLLNNHLSGKRTNFNKLSTALRRLSKDSDRAAEQFYEMFISNEKSLLQ